MIITGKMGLLSKRSRSPNSKKILNCHSRRAINIVLTFRIHNSLPLELIQAFISSLKSFVACQAKIKGKYNGALNLI